MSGRLKIELIRACVSEKSKSWRMKLQKVHVFKRLTSGVIFFPLKLLSLNKYSWCVWLEQVTRVLLAAVKHWHLYHKTHSELKGQHQLCDFWQKKWGCICSGLNWSRLSLEIRLISRKIRFGMLFDFSQTFCGFLFMVISDQLFGYPCVLAVSSLVVEIMTSETLFLNP